MTLVTGTVQDLGYEPLDGVLYARPARFRSDGGVILAPERTPYPLAAGAVSVDLAPGPAVLELKVGSHARGTFDVVIPDQASITLGDLLDTVFPWEPAQVSQFVAQRELAEAAKKTAVSAADDAEGFAGTATTAAQQAGADRAHVDAIREQLDEAAQGNVAPYLTTTALNATYGRKMLIDANQHGVKADGVTNDAPAWNALVQSCGPGDVITWTGRSMLDNPIIWKSGVSLVGQGWGHSVLAPRDTTGIKFFAAIRFAQQDGASATNMLRDCTFANFEGDSTEMVGTAQAIGGKICYTQFHERCQWLNLYLHDTPGTALGVDYMRDSIISGCLIVRGGRNWTGTAAGHAGIGLGTGAWVDESCIVTGNTTVECGHWGIFVEWQVDQPVRSRGYSIVGNIIRTTRGWGIGDAGNHETLIANNIVTGGLRSGIYVRDHGSTGVIRGNTITDNVQSGIWIPDGAGNGWTIDGNKCARNGRRGIELDFVTAGVRSGFSIVNNECVANGLEGIRATSPAATGSFLNLTVQANRCLNNGQSGTANYNHGINIETTTTGLQLAGNRCYDDQVTKTQSAGIKLPASQFTWTDGFITGNHLIGNKDSSLARSNAVLTNTVMRNNQGALTENAGAANMPGSSTTVTVLHGLIAAPKSVTLTPKLGEQLWVTTLGTSGFVVNRATSGTSLDFIWTAQV